MDCDPITDRCDEIARELSILNPRQDQQDVIQGVSIASAALGAVLGGIGLGLFFASPSDADVDRAAHAELRVGPGSLALRGAF